MTVVARTRVQKVVSRLKGLLGRLAIAKSTRRPRSVSGSGETGRSRAHLEVDRARSASAEFVLARQAILGPSLAPGESAEVLATDCWAVCGLVARDTILREILLSPCMQAPSASDAKQGEAAQFCEASR